MYHVTTTHLCLARTFEYFTILARQFIKWLLKSLYCFEIKEADGINTIQKQPLWNLKIVMWNREVHHHLLGSTVSKHSPPKNVTGAEVWRAEESCKHKTLCPGSPSEACSQTLRSHERSMQSQLCHVRYSRSFPIKEKSRITNTPVLPSNLWGFNTGWTLWI